MAIDTLLTFEKVITELQSVLKNSSDLPYVPSKAIIISSPDEKDTIPSFDSYCIKLVAPDSGFLQRIPRIGQHFRYIYTVAVELWLKSGLSLADRLRLGKFSRSKGIWDFYHDVVNTLEHNTLSSQLDPYPGSNLSNPVTLLSDEKLIEGVGFLWFGNRDNLL